MTENEHDTIPREIRDKMDRATQGMTDKDRAMVVLGFRLGSLCATEQMERTVRTLKNSAPDILTHDRTVRG